MGNSWLLVVALVVGSAAGLYRTPPPDAIVREGAARVALAGTVLAAWTVLAGVVWIVAAFAATDTRCGDATFHPRVGEPAGAFAAVTAFVWAVPFVVGALRRRTVAWTLLAGAALVVSGYFAWCVLANPASFCL
ncbi:MAG TPA: hypothetical protein VGL39_26335 [Jatrophihabitantaceae bacterium]|jgi:hypothetical protein